MIYLKEITVIAFLTALILCFKYILGFVPGVEIVTFCCLLYGALLPWRMWILIVISFILLVGVIYGFGLWWIVYWFIFLTESFLSWLFKKIMTRNSFIFALWCGFWGFSLIGWYFIFDLIFFGKAQAISSLSTALIPNLLGLLSNFLVGFLLLEPSKKVFFHYLKLHDVNYWTSVS